MDVPGVVEVEVLAAGVRVGEVDAAEGHLQLLPRGAVRHLCFRIWGLLEVRAWWEGHVGVHRRAHGWMHRVAAANRPLEVD